MNQNCCDHLNNKGWEHAQTCDKRHKFCWQRVRVYSHAGNNVFGCDALKYVTYKNTSGFRIRGRKLTTYVYLLLLGRFQGLRAKKNALNELRGSFNMRHKAYLTGQWKFRLSWRQAPALSYYLDSFLHRRHNLIRAFITWTAASAMYLWAVLIDDTKGCSVSKFVLWETKFEQGLVTLISFLWASGYKLSPDTDCFHRFQFV